MTEESSERPKSRRHISDSTKGWAGILTGLTGLVAAIAAINRPPDERAARESYVVLSERVKELSALQQQTTEDVRRQGEWLASLRGYVDGMKSVPVSSSLRARARHADVEEPPAPAPAPELPPAPTPKATAMKPQSLPPFAEISEAARAAD
jgi:hypothetical protein